LATYDGGVSWKTVTAIGNRPVNSVTVAHDSTGKRRIFVGTGKGQKPGMLLFSDNAGATWDSVPGLDARNNPGRKQLPVRDVETHPGTIDTFFIACGDNTDWAVGWTFDGGKTISTPKQGMGGAEISKIAVNKNHPDSVYFAMRNQICLLDFSPIKGDGKITDPQGNTIVLESPQFMQNWFVGYPGEILYDIHFDDLMMASSVGAFGVKSNDKSTPIITAGTSVKKSSVAIQNTQSMLMISLNSAAAGNVKVTLYDLKGRVIAVPFDGFAKAGVTSIAVDTKRYASGCYILSIATPSEKHSLRTILAH